MYELTEDQQQVYNGIFSHLKQVKGDIFNEHSSISLTGAAGVGKTFMTKELIKGLLDLPDNYNIAILAPTHKALQVIKSNIGISDKRLRFSTVHSFLGLSIQYKDDGTETYKKRPKYEIPKVDIVIIDESSFINRELYDHISSIIYKGSSIKGVLYIGDELQLLPVESDNRKPEAVVFNAKNNMNKFKLTKVLRNGNLEVLDFYTEIRYMIEQGKSKDILTAFLKQTRSKNLEKIHFYDSKKDFLTNFISKDRIKKETDIILSFTNHTVDVYNKMIRNYYVDNSEISTKDLVVVQSPYSSVHNPKKSLKVPDIVNSETLSIDYIEEETVGYGDVSFDVWSCTENKLNRKFYILKESEKERFEKVKIKMKDHILKSKNRNWSVYYDFIGMFLDFKFHYSCTIHKAQGSSYEDVYIDMSSLDSFGNIDSDTLLRLFYVGASRARNNIHICVG